MLWIVEFIYQCGRKEEYLCGALRGSSPPLPSPPPQPLLLSTFYQYDGCLSSLGHGGSWLGCQVLPAIGTVSILELATNSGSSRMSQAHNLHIATQLLIPTQQIWIKYLFLSLYPSYISNTVSSYLRDFVLNKQYTSQFSEWTMCKGPLAFL